MMHEDLIKEINEEKKMGLDLSDTAYYNVDDGVTDEPLIADLTEKEEDGKNPGKRLGILASFLLGVIACLGTILLCTQVFGAGSIPGRTWSSSTIPSPPLRLPT